MDNLKVFLTANDTNGIIYNIPYNEMPNRITVNLQDGKFTTQNFYNTAGQCIISCYDTFKCITHFRIFDMELILLIHDITNDMRVLQIDEHLLSDNICNDLFAFLPQGSLADSTYSDSDLSFNYNYQSGYSVYVRVINSYNKDCKYLKLSSDGKVEYTTAYDFFKFDSIVFEQLSLVEQFLDPRLFYTIKRFEDGATLTMPNRFNQIAFSKVVLKVTGKENSLNLYKI